MNLLIGDDDRAFASQLATAESDQDVEVVVTDSVDALIQAMRQQRFDHLVLEPNLPGALWYSLLHMVREACLELPITIVTAYPSRALMRVAASLDIDRVFSKPVAYEDVFAAMEGKWFENCKSEVRRVEPSLARIEWEYINSTIQRCGGNMAEASSRLGLPRQTLYRKLRKHPPAR
jgi:ActR/RegA family two-component response regulator